MSLLGAVSAHRVEAELVATLKTWTHTYLGAAERANGMPVNSIIRPQSYRRTSGETVAVDEHLLPRIVLRSSGWRDRYVDDGKVTVTLPVTVAGYWKGRKTVETLDRIRVAEAAVHELLEHKGASGPLIDSVTLIDADYDVIDSSLEETLTAFEINLTALVPDVIRLGSGPTQADPPPVQTPDQPVDYPDPPTAETVLITTHHLDEEQ